MRVFGIDPGSPELGHRTGNAVALLAPDETDSRDAAWRIRKGCDDRKGGGCVGDVGQVDIDTTECSSRHLHMIGTEFDVTAHLTEHRCELDVSLERITPQTVDPDPTSSDCGCGEEVRG